MISIQDRYVFSIYIKNFIASLLLCGMLVLFSRGLEMTRPMGQHGAPWSEMFWYLLFEIPWVIREVLPTVVLLATFFSFGILKRNSELTALMNGGIPLWKITRGAMILVIGTAIFQVFAEQAILPSTTFYSRVHKNIIRGREPEPDMVGNIIVRTAPRITLYITSLDIRKKRMIYPRYTELNANGGIKISVDAYITEWDVKKKKWISEGVIYREFAEENLLVEKKIPRYEMPLNIDMDELLLLIKAQRGAGENYYPLFVQGEGASLTELRRALLSNKRVHLKVYPLRTTLYYKIIFPFSYILLFFIGVSVAMRVGRESSLNINFGIAMMASFVLWGIMQICRTLGTSGAVPPMAAVGVPPLFMFYLSWKLWRK